MSMPNITPFFTHPYPEKQHKIGRAVRAPTILFIQSPNHQTLKSSPNPYRYKTCNFSRFHKIYKISFN